MSTNKTGLFIVGFVVVAFIHGIYLLVERFCMQAGTDVNKPAKRVAIFENKTTDNPIHLPPYCPVLSKQR